MDKKLIELLPNYPAIWKRSSIAFKNKSLKQKSFGDLARALNTTVEHVQDRYKSVREKYRKERLKEKIKLKSGDEAALSESWELMDGLRFLDEVMLSRRSTSNIKYGETFTTEEYGQSEITIDEPSLMQDTEVKEASPFFSLVSSSPSTSSLSSGRNLKRKVDDSPLVDILHILKDVATSLQSIESPTRFHWIGKYITDRLNEMDPNVADEAVAEIIQLLNTKPKIEV